MAKTETSELPKVYLFAHGSMGRDALVVVALAESGHVLGNHVCSNMSFARHDLAERGDRKAALESHYPGGYDVVVLPDGMFPPDEVFERNKALAPAVGVEQGGRG